ncbi:MAG: hypothetical protein RSA29_02530 [Clostridium sp.]|uniref:hypothetical protein n=1 Tax=Clostridium sp. TaxID=1506 RepID=UPI0030669625
MGMKISLSFKEDEIDIYEFIKSKRNASCYIKDLVENDMSNKGFANTKNEVKTIKKSNELEIEF